ncbi:hypothetical protein OTK49_02855 [Vibrio coralliirubri]|uniref:hypothetical protein n=1 Tax=Vibrio coralliirubri TaxID=1516159 RepID=UPI002283C520|nr:hypothetical protein [Vibrio coralliirubri]MCY9861458.1 hypothetical protein [Vibrio coralliirubri]
MDLIQFFFNLPNSGWSGWLILSLFAVLAILLLSLLVYVIDRVGIKSKPCKVTVIGRFHTPTKTITSTTFINGSPIITSTVIPEYWSLNVVDSKNEIMPCQVSHNAYLNVPSETIWTGMVGRGRLTGGKYCTEILLDPEYL